MTAKEMIAVAKMGLGGVKMVSGVMTGLGHGLMGAYCRDHRLINTGLFIARRSCLGGKEMFEQGRRELEAERGG